VLPACLPDMTNYDFDAWLISVRHFYVKRKDQQHAARYDKRKTAAGDFAIYDSIGDRKYLSAAL
jgi:hypothetical protein